MLKKPSITTPQFLFCGMKNLRFIIPFSLLLLGAAAGCGDSSPEQAETTLPASPGYQRDLSWPSEMTTASMGQPIGVGLMPDGQVAVFHRGKGTPVPYVPGDVVAFIDPISGDIVNSWGGATVIQSHGMHIDWTGNVWLTDIKLHQVFKFSAEGELLLTLGTAGEAGLDESHFDQPTDVAIAPNGNIFVTDGYGNRRIVKFSPNGDFLLEWGSEGGGVGQFLNPHSIDISQQGTLYVADRDNNRIQLFDLDGNFLDTIPTRSAIYACIIDEATNELLATDFLQRDTTTLGSDVFLIDLEDPTPGGAFIGHSHDSNSTPCRYHDIVRDGDGTIYLVDLIGKSVEKWRVID